VEAQVILAWMFVFLIIISSLVFLFTRNLLMGVISVEVVSLGVAYLFLILGAPDVAMAQAAIGTGLTLALFLSVIHRTKEDSSVDNDRLSITSSPKELFSKKGSSEGEDK